MLPAPKVYEPVPSLDFVREKANQYLEKYNEENPSKPMNLVLFDAAIQHLMTISRIIQVSKTHKEKKNTTPRKKRKRKERERREKRRR